MARAGAMPGPGRVPGRMGCSRLRGSEPVSRHMHAACVPETPTWRHRRGVPAAPFEWLPPPPLTCHLVEQQVSISNILQGWEGRRRLDRRSKSSQGAQEQERHG